MLIPKDAENFIGKCLAYFGDTSEIQHDLRKISNPREIRFA